VVTNGCDDVSLLALRGICNGSDVECLLDSGASANFIARHNLLSFGVDYDLDII
jgi:hypothetical protein